MDDSKVVVIQFKVTDGVRRGLRIEAAKDGKSLSEYLRYAVQNYLDTHDVELDLSQGIDTWGGNRQGKDEDEE